MMDDTIGWLDSKRQGNEPSVQTLARVLMALEVEIADLRAAIMAEVEAVEEEETPKSKKGK